MKVLSWVFVSVFLLQAEDGALAQKIPRWWLKVAQRQGPNACVVEEIPNSNTEFWTECRYWRSRKICGKKTRIRFECCEGFSRIDDEVGCTRVKPLKNLLETAEALGATKWAAYIRESGLANELETAGAYTLFAPTNEAFSNLRRSLKSQMESYRGNPNNPILLYHILPTKLKSDEFKANLMAETRHQGHNVRINKYSNGMTTINCALLIRKDQQATNGIVHVIDNVLDPSVGILQNVADMVLNDGRFSVLADILEKSGYINVLRTMQESITILAPSDEAFQKLPESRREKIINDREARMALLQNHVIPHVICESAITGEHRVRTMLDSKITFNCDIAGAYVENTKLRGNFNLGKNGIIHMIDDVLLPDRAKNLIELAESRNLFTFVELVKKAGLEETLSHTGDYTFFVPDEAAWYSLDSEVLSAARRDLELAGQLVRFHGAYGRHLTNAITDNQAIMSLDEENPVRLQVWRRALGVEDAKITEKDIEAQNGVIHIINKVIVPSNQSVQDILRIIPQQRFNIFLEALQQASSQENSVLSLGPGDEVFYTFFVPPDSAFRQLNSETLSKIKQDDRYLMELIKSHIAINMFPATSFEKNLVYTIEGMGGPFDIKKTDQNAITVNGASVTSSHMSAKGVIHVINKVFLPENSYTYSSYSSSSSSSSRGSGRSSYSSSSSSSSWGSTKSSRRTYKKTVTLAETYGDEGKDDSLPAFPQGTVFPSSSSSSPTARAKRRKTSRGYRRRKAFSSPSSTRPSSGVTTTSPTTSPDDTWSNTPDDSSFGELEETHLQGSGFSARESEASQNSHTTSGQDSYDVREPYSTTEPGLTRSSSRSSSRRTHKGKKQGGGSYTEREGSYSSSSYTPSSSSSSSSHIYDFETQITRTEEGEAKDSDTGHETYGSSTTYGYDDASLHLSGNDVYEDTSSSRQDESGSHGISTSSSSRHRGNTNTHDRSSTHISDEYEISRRSEFANTNSNDLSESTVSSSDLGRNELDLSYDGNEARRTSSDSDARVDTTTQYTDSDTRYTGTRTRYTGSDRDTQHTVTDTRYRGTDTRYTGFDADRRRTEADARYTGTDTRYTETGTGYIESEADTRHTGTDTEYTESDTRYTGSDTDRRRTETDTRYTETGTRYTGSDAVTQRTETETRYRGTDTRYTGSDTDRQRTDIDTRYTGTESDNRRTGTDTRYTESDASRRRTEADTRYTGTERRYTGYGTDRRRTETGTRYTGTDSRYAKSDTDRRRTETDTRYTGTDTRYYETDTRHTGTETDSQHTGTNTRYTGSDAEKRRTEADTRYTETDTRYTGTDTRYTGFGADRRRTETGTRYTGAEADTRRTGTDTRYTGTDSRYAESDTDKRRTETGTRYTETRYTGSDAVTRRTGTDTRYTETGTRYTGTEADTRNKEDDSRYTGTDTDTRYTLTSTSRTGIDTRYTGTGTDTQHSESDTRHAGKDMRYTGTDRDTQRTGTDTRYTLTKYFRNGTVNTGTDADAGYNGEDSRYAGTNTDTRYHGSDIRHDGTDTRYGIGTNTQYSGTGTRYNENDTRYSGTGVDSTLSYFNRTGYTGYAGGYGTGANSTLSYFNRTGYTGYAGGSGTGADSRLSYFNRTGFTEGSGSGINNVAGARGGYSTSTSSRTYTYHYSGGSGQPGGSLTHGDLQPLPTGGFRTYNSTTIHRETTDGPSSPDGGRFSYVGHPYGQDVIGHTDTVGGDKAALPFTLGQAESGAASGSTTQGGAAGFGTNTYHYRYSSHAEDNGPIRGDNAVASGGLSSSSRSSSHRSNSHRKYGVRTHTVVTYPATVETHSRSTKTYTFGSGGKPRSSSVSAYAFTGDDTEYADGTEFAEAKSGDEETISRKEAVSLRRRWRRKRHQKRAEGRRRRGRRGGRRKVAAKQ
ncbi:serine-rich adhesin for platelets-like [Penaeus monodon]|uniref:serine-rich adhesin for platelets-like n=1 Tax=Penaeus monodon TaxID=6687 RepID=UPI0018A7DA4C|nr:serine-rich adhesin for platelets-like [Penaeus monodon]